MKCPGCGAEIKEGFLYCSVCGEEIRIVPDYEPEIFVELSESISQVAEDYEAMGEASKEGADTMPFTLHSDEEISSDTENPVEETPFKEDEVTEKDPIRERPKKRRKREKGSGLNIAVLLLAGTLFAAFVLFAILRFNRYFDYDIQYADALALHDEGKYEESLIIAKHALSINNSEDKTRLLISDDYRELKKYDESNAVLFAMLSDGADVSVYDRIIDNYLAVGDYNGVIELINNSEDATLMERYAAYFADVPVFSKESGDYETDFKLSLTSKAPGVIYYTTDGSVPDNTSEVYKYPLDIEEGEITVSAVFVNEYGISSQPVSKTYSVSYPVAKAPKLLVSGGSYEIPQMIRVEVPENYKVFYERGDKDPDANSNEYKRALDMPIGSSEYRFVAIDDKGRMSEVIDVKYSLKMVCLVDLETALNAVKIQLMSKGENSLLNEYKCSYGYGYEGNSFYLIDEYTYAGSRTGRRFAVDTKTGSIFEASWNPDRQDYTLSVV